MDRTSVEQVRAFNRVVTQRIGVLQDEYLDRGRPLGASRVLWEIGSAGDEGTDARTLRSRLDLDSGYLSRLLRALEADGLVDVQPDPGDRRVRRLGLTEAGRSERALLDERSDDLARSLLAPLRADQQDALVTAMAQVERLLTAGLVDLRVEDPTSEDAQHCLRSYYRELDERFATGFDPDVSRPVDVEEITEPRGLLLVARLHGRPVGCGALKLHDDEPAEIKRMWVDRVARGLGVGRRLLSELEQQAQQRGAAATRLDTNQALVEAIALYRSAGYVEVPAFNDEPYAHHWFEKALA